VPAHQSRPRARGKEEGVSTGWCAWSSVGAGGRWASGGDVARLPELTLVARLRRGVPAPVLGSTVGGQGRPQPQSDLLPRAVRDRTRGGCASSVAPARAAWALTTGWLCLGRGRGASRRGRAALRYARGGGRGTAYGSQGGRAYLSCCWRTKPRSAASPSPKARSLARILHQRLGPPPVVRLVLTTSRFLQSSPTNVRTKQKC
jgi:hypothetical protein